MADNDNKIVVNVPGQENVDPSEVTQSSPAFDPLTGRDTDTGSLNKLNDTRTRKTIKLKPTGPTPTVPVINIDSEPVPTESTPISDVIAGRDTETGGLDRLNDTRTRKTVKLAPLSPPGVPKITIGVPPAPSGTPAPISLKPVVAPPINLSPVPAPAAEAPSMTNTDTGSLQTLNDTNTRKTVKLSPAPLTPAPAINIATPAVEPEPAMTNTDTGSLQMLDDTKTRKAIKLSPTPVGPTTAETIVLTPPPPPPVPVQQLKPITPPQALKPVVPVPAPVPAPTMVLTPQPDDAAPMPVAEDDDTIKLQRKTVTQNGTSASTQSHSDISPLPTVAAAKTVPGSKQTIKLRPSSGGTAAPDEVKKPTEPPKIAEASKPSARDTIKLSPTAAPGVIPTLAPSPAAVTPSAPTLNLATPTPPPAPAVTPSAPTVNLKAPTMPPVAPAPVTPPAPVAEEPAVEAPAVEAPPPPKQTLSLKPKLPTVPTVAPPPPVATPAPEKPDEVSEMAPANEAVEGEEAPEAPKKGGLKLGKKQGGDEAVFVPPKVQKGINDMETGVGTEAAQGMSKLYTAVAAVTVLCLIATTYLTAAQYVNLWQQAKVKTKLPVPFLQKNK